LLIEVKIHDSKPGYISFFLPISAQGLPAVCRAGLPAVLLEGLPAVLLADLSAVIFTRRLSCPPSLWRSGGLADCFR